MLRRQRQPLLTAPARWQQTAMLMTARRPSDRCTSTRVPATGRVERLGYSGDLKQRWAGQVVLRPLRRPVPRSVESHGEQRPGGFTVRPVRRPVAEEEPSHPGGVQQPLHAELTGVFGDPRHRNSRRARRPTQTAPGSYEQQHGAVHTIKEITGLVNRASDVNQPDPRRPRHTGRQRAPQGYQPALTCPSRTDPTPTNASRFTAVGAR